jgi:hypothetical protein
LIEKALREEEEWKVCRWKQENFSHCASTRSEVHHTFIARERAHDDNVSIPSRALCQFLAQLDNAAAVLLVVHVVNYEAKTRNQAELLLIFDKRECSFY